MGWGCQVVVVVGLPVFVVVVVVGMPVVVMVVARRWGVARRRRRGQSLSP
jgi:hypothetical protein